MKIFNGKRAAGKILLFLKNKIKKEKITPRLAVILVGDDSASKLYIKLKKKAARKVGIKVVQYNFKKNVKENSIVKKIVFLNKNTLINGILVQLPLPGGFNTDKIVQAIDPKKDVDGFHKINRDLLKKGKNPFLYPILPSGILIALKSAAKNLKNKKIVALVNSKVLGQTLKDFFKKEERIKINYLLRRNIADLNLKSADVIITVCGKANLIKGEMVKNKVILIDAGFTYFRGKSVGDVNRESVEEKAAFLTPVPGGIGPLTVALLLKNVYLAAKKYGKHS